MGKRRVREAAPYRGEFPLWRAATWGRPYGAIRTGSVGWETQAQSVNRSKIKFCTLRAPVGLDGNAPKHS